MTQMPLVLKIPRRLESPNASRGAHWRVRHRISQEWEWEILLAHRTDGQVRRYVHAHLRAEGWGVGRMKVLVERYVPSARNFIRDDDNLRFSVKPILDALKRQGYIKNDSRKWLDHPTPTQHVSEDGKDYTVIRIEAVS